MITFGSGKVGFEGWEGVSIGGDGRHETQLKVLAVRQRKTSQNAVSEFQRL